MLTFIKRALFRMWRSEYREIYPDEIFLDSKNLPEFDRYQFEGRIEKTISSKSLAPFYIIPALFLLIFCFKLGELQIKDGAKLRDRSTNNSLKETLLVSPRGKILSRNGVALAWNQILSESQLIPERKYIQANGFSKLLGFLKYPAKDKNGFYYETEFIPKDGVELYMNEILTGKNGWKLTETNSKGEIISESTIDPPKAGEDLVLSIDSRIQADIFKNIAGLASDAGFQGGAAVIMDINSGEILAMASFPEYDSTVLTIGKDKDLIDGYFANKSNPFLNRVTSGLFTPGSIVKPFVAFAALEEKIIDPLKQIESTGQLVLPNPYNPSNPSIFKDWKAHGFVDMRRAIAVSSDVYFYQIGGGFGSQKGLGIEKLEKYFKIFGFGEATGIITEEEESGVIPNPKWKEDNFDGEIWRIGNTYHTAIGQYGMQITPIQAVRAIAALANGGYLVTPSLVFSATSSPQTGSRINGGWENFKIVQEGMRQAVTEGTAKGLDTQAVSIAAKTGTAELGDRKQFVNSWTVGFFPYEKPKYAFAVVMERGPVKNLVGATYVMRQTIDSMARNTPEYFSVE